MPKKIRAILEDELLDWVVIKKWETIETNIADYLLNRYPDRRELVEENDSKEESKEEKKEEKKAEKKVSKKK